MTALDRDEVDRLLREAAPQFVEHCWPAFCALAEDIRALPSLGGVGGGGPKNTGYLLWYSCKKHGMTFGNDQPGCPECRAARHTGGEE